MAPATPIRRGGLTAVLSPTDLPGVTDDGDMALLARAAAWPELLELSDINADSLSDLSQREGIELATALLFDRLTRSPLHGPFIERIESLRRAPGTPDVLAGAASARLRGTLFIVPGAYYREYPEVGGDGRLLLDAAKGLRCETRLIETQSVGGVHENARRINAALLSHTTGPVILCSLSKGGADVKAALARPDAHEAFRNVVAWVDLCGITHGTPLASRIVHTLWLNALARALFLLRGHDFRFLVDLVPSPHGPLAGRPRVHSTMRVIHVVGVPLPRHPSTRLLQRHYRRLTPHGPNDGCTVLGHVTQLPGLIYPIWGADHYLRPPWDIRTLAAALMCYVGEECGLLEG